MTIYVTPFDPITKDSTGPSEDCGLPDLDSAAEMFGPDWVRRNPRLITYADFVVSDFNLRTEPAA